MTRKSPYTVVCLKGPGTVGVGRLSNPVLGSE